jgi:ADP-heptose:LPS heptosyltransferase
VTARPSGRATVRAAALGLTLVAAGCLTPDRWAVFQPPPAERAAPETPVSPAEARAYQSNLEDPPTFVTPPPGGVWELSLEQAVMLLSQADAVVSNDSGLMHVAAALQRPLVAVYGSTDPGFTPPLNDNSRIVRLGLDCSPCFKRECPLGHLDCLNRLPASRVIAELEELLA